MTGTLQHVNHIPLGHSIRRGLEIEDVAVKWGLRIACLGVMGGIIYSIIFPSYNVKVSDLLTGGLMGGVAGYVLGGTLAILLTASDQAAEKQKNPFMKLIMFVAVFLIGTLTLAAATGLLQVVTLIF